METLQRPENPSSDVIQSDLHNRLSLQLRHGIPCHRKKQDTESNGSPTTAESTDIDDEDPEDEDECNDEESIKLKDSTCPQPARRQMVCGMCHLPPGVTGVAGVSTSPGPMLTCTQGHLLCQQCVHRYTVCSDKGCVVCGADLYTSTSRTCYQVTNCMGANHPRENNSPPAEVPPRGVQSEMRCNVQRATQQISNNYKTRNYNQGGDNFAQPFFGGYSNYPTGYNSQCSAGWDGDSGDVIQASSNSMRDNHQRRPSYCSMMRGDDADPEGTEVAYSYGRSDRSGSAALVQAECSRRPIRCPRLDCAVNVAFSALTHHFLFDHPEVPILSVEPGMKSTLIVSFAALSCNSSRCLALLLVSGKLTGAAARLFNGSQIKPRYRNRLPLPVLAARLHCSSQNPCNDKDHSHGPGQGQSQEDVVIVWVAGLDVGGATTGALRCSIEAADGNENGAIRSLMYTGPVNSLRTAQRPREVFMTGDCVILHQGLIDHITSGFTSLNVNVIVH
ncbi:uncharacterized protein LOC105692662 [Athalia rosae]|uniref:uncharacterized protein LOC105692662 n=1 Tax=Athalia rosae TaxID=37344 RepID=UPI002033B285|nr:uncharacterized protein LOC105692662 [Athalia rosae]